MANFFLYNEDDGFLDKLSVIILGCMMLLAAVAAVGIIVAFAVVMATKVSL